MIKINGKSYEDNEIKFCFEEKEIGSFIKYKHIPVNLYLWYLKKLYNFHSIHFCKKYIDICQHFYNSSFNQNCLKKEEEERKKEFNILTQNQKYKKLFKIKQLIYLYNVNCSNNTHILEKNLIVDNKFSLILDKLEFIKIDYKIKFFKNNKKYKLDIILNKVGYKENTNFIKLYHIKKVQLPICYIGVEKYFTLNIKNFKNLQTFEKYVNNKYENSFDVFNFDYKTDITRGAYNGGDFTILRSYKEGWIL